MREKLKKMRNPSENVWIPQTREEQMDDIVFVRAVRTIPEIPMADREVFDGIGNGKRNDAVQASLFDAIHAEMLGEKISRREKFMRNHYVRNDGKPIRKDKRKSYRKELCYSCDPWIGWGVVKHKREQEQVASRMADFRMELEEHESMMAVYYDLMTFATQSRDMAESVMDERIDTVHMTPEKAVRYRKMYEKDAETMTESALNILKGECY